MHRVCNFFAYRQTVQVLLQESYKEQKSNFFLLFYGIRKGYFIAASEEASELSLESWRFSGGRLGF